MKIAILTLPLHVNFGGILQAYALQTVLERMGNEVKVLTRSRKRKITLKTIGLSIPKRVILKLLGKQKNKVFEEWTWNKDLHVMGQHTQPFIDAHIHCDDRPIEALQESDYDCYVVGSDQIWRPKYIKSSINISIPNAFLHFARQWKKIKISYAASFGTDTWEYSEADTSTIKELAKLFDSVSVREKTGVKLCKENLGVEATHVLDPTLLLESDDYKQLIANQPDSEGDMMCYILDETQDKLDLINQVSKDRSLRPFTVGAQIDNWTLPGEKRIQPPVEKWLKGFNDSKFIITDSFHACAFAIIFGKPFIVVGNENRGLSRFHSLLSTFGLQDNLITSSSEYSSQKAYSINPEAEQKIKTERQKSLDYLHSALKN